MSCLARSAQLAVRRERENRSIGLGRVWLLRISKIEEEKSGQQAVAAISDLDYLQAILSNYNYNSLEYKAIKQEIDRLRKSSK